MSYRTTLGFCVIAVLLVSVPSTAHAAAYLLVNFADGESIEAGAAAQTFESAVNGERPTKIDGAAERYFVHLPYATMNVLSGAATRVGGQPAAQSTSGMAESAAVSADTAAGPDEDSGDTGWIEYESPAASLMLFSPDGMDEESEVRYEPARLFLRRLADGSVYVMMTVSDGASPAD